MVKNLISAFFSRGFVALSNFAILLLSTRYLGSEIVGQVSLFILNIAIIQTVNEIYTGSALVYFIPRSNLKTIYRQGVLFSLVSTLLLAFVFILAGKPGNTNWMHLICLAFMITMHTFHNLLLLAREKIKQFNVMVFLQPVLMVLSLGTSIFILNMRSLQAYILSLYVSFGISLLVSSAMLAGVFSQNKQTGNPGLFEVLKNGFMNQLGNLAHTLSNRFNYYLLGATALVGVYSSSTSLIESVWIISGSVSPLILSHVANQTDTQNNAKLSLLLAKLCFVLGLFCVLILYFLPPELFTWLLGRDFEQSKSLMLRLSPGVLCLTFSSIISHYFSGLGKQNILLTANLSGLFITLCTAWPLINAFGLFGACYAASLAYFVQAAVLVFVFLKQNKLNLRALISVKIERALLGK